MKSRCAAPWAPAAARCSRTTWSRFHASSGTTGKRKVLCYTRRDIDDWAAMFARCYEMAELTRQDRVQIAVGYGLWTAGVGFQLGCERFGAMAVSVGPANTEMHCQMLVDLQSTVFCATTSMALLMAEEIDRHGLRREIGLNKIIFGAERHSQRTRERIQELTGVEHLYDIPWLTELYGPGTGLECAAHQGIHFWADYYILEIFHPETLKPVAPGELGEMVVTTLRNEAAPLIRYRTRDLTRLIPEPCPCGNPAVSEAGTGPLFESGLAQTFDARSYRELALLQPGNPLRGRRISEDLAMRRMFQQDLILGSRSHMQAIFLDAMLFGRPWGFSLADIRVPIHLWYGDSDTIVPVHHGEHLAERIPGAKLRVRAEEGHLGGLAASQEIFDTLLEHWPDAGVPRRRSRSANVRRRRGDA